MISNISISELSKLIGKVQIIDIRNIESYNNNHILNAKNIPADILINNPKKYFNKNTTYYIYCTKGMTSIKVCSLLNSLGYKTVNIKGGYESWILEK